MKGSADFKGRFGAYREAIDADIVTYGRHVRAATASQRYERIYARARDSESQKTFEQFTEQDAYENRGLSDTGPGRGIRYIIDSADMVIANDGSLDELEAALKERLQPLFT